MTSAHAAVGADLRCLRHAPSRGRAWRNALSRSGIVSYSRHLIEVFTTDGFDRWLRKPKDRQGRLRILSRIDRLAHGHAGDVKAVGQGVLELRLAYGLG